MVKVFHTKGGACIGWVHSAPPLASLSSSKKKLEIDVLLTGKYKFTPEDVVKIEEVSIIPIILIGIRIHHTIASYPERILFITIKKPEDIIKGIKESGFTCTAKQSDLDTLNNREFPVKILPIVIVVILWNLLFLVGITDFFSDPSIKTLVSPWMIFAFAMVFLLSTIIKLVPSMAKIFLKPKRDINEILPYINLLMVVSGSTMFFMTIFKLFNL